MGLLCGEGCVILTSTSMTDPPVWQTDWQTDGWMGDGIERAIAYMLSRIKRLYQQTY